MSLLDRIRSFASRTNSTGLLGPPTVGTPGRTTPGTPGVAGSPTTISPDHPIDTSIVSIERNVFSSTGWLRYNPDDLVKKKGLAIYAKMRTDEQVKAVSTFKRDAIISRGWTFEFDDDSPLPDAEQELRTKIFNRVITKMPGSFIDSLNAISTGRDYGYSLTEKVYAPLNVEGKQWVGIGALLGRDPSTFEFITDKFGQLVQAQQRAGGELIELDLDKFIHYVHNPEFDVYFGQSDLREAYRPWFFKDVLFRYWAMYMEKLGGGMAVATVSDTAGIPLGSAKWQQLTAIMSQLKSSASLVVPAGVTIDIKFPTNSDAFEKAMESQDLAIAKALLVPNLMGVSHTGKTGSYSQSQTQLESFAWTVNADTARLESCLNEQLFFDLGEQNWGDQEYPVFKFKPMGTEILRWLVTTWATLTEAGAVIPTIDDEQRLRDIMGMPERDEDEEPLAAVIARTAPVPAPTVDRGGAPTEGGGEPPSPIKHHRARNQRRTIKHHRAHTPNGLPRNVSQAAFDRAVDRVQFSVIENKTTADQRHIVNALSLAVAKAVNRAIPLSDLMRYLAIHTSQTPTIDLSAADRGRIKAICSTGLQDGYKLGVTTAMDELGKAAKELPSTIKKNVRFASLRDNAAQYFEARAYKMSGDISDRAAGVIQNEVLNGIKYGLSPEAVRANIWDRLVTQGLTSSSDVRATEADDAVNAALDALWKDSTEGALAYLNTAVRTTMFEALNEARFAEFTDPANADFVQALEYSAVLDDRTTEICIELNGTILDANSPEWDDIRPPNHFNCRSILVPITTQDDWNGKQSKVPSVSPAPGFGAGD